MDCICKKCATREVNEAADKAISPSRNQVAKEMCQRRYKVREEFKRVE